jgi:ribonuclease HI
VSSTVFIDVLEHLVPVEILCQSSDVCMARKSDVFWWVPGHTGLHGIEATDAAAKEDTFMKFWHQNELLVVMLMLVFIM